MNEDEAAVERADAADRRIVESTIKHRVRLYDYMMFSVHTYGIDYFCFVFFFLLYHMILYIYIFFFFFVVVVTLSNM